MKRSIRNYLRLFTSSLYLSAFTLGGGYVIVPLMKKKYVDELGWLEEDEMLNMTAIAQSSPGAIAINTALLVGWKLLGAAGAAVAFLGTVLPPFLIMLVISLFYASFRDNPIVSAVLKGMMAGVCAVVMDAVISMSFNIIKNKKVLPVIIMILAFLVSFIFKINVIYIIVFCGVLGALISAHDHKSGKEHL